MSRSLASSPGAAVGSRRSAGRPRPPRPRSRSSRAFGRSVRSVSASSSSSSASSSASAVDEPALLRRLRDLAGDANGTDRNDAQRSEIAELLEASLGPSRGVSGVASSSVAPSRVDLAGTSWNLLYTDSGGNSSGKLGPFVGAVTQAFEPEPGSGRDKNVVDLGPLTLELSATCSATDDRTIKVVFDDLAVILFGVELLRKPFPPGRAGTWRMALQGEELRVLYTNQGNVFALERKR